MRILLLLLTLLSISPFAAYTFQVEPMTAELRPFGSESQVLLRITNTSNEKLTAEISSFDLLINSQGEEELVLNEGDFLIIPMTVIIAPGKSQSIVVKYIGEPVLTESITYRIDIRQLGVNLGKGNLASVGVNYNFQTLYSVVPEQASAQLVIKSKKQASAGIWKVKLANTGNKYARLLNTQWIIEGQNDKLVLDGRSLSDALAGKLLLPNSSREVSLKVPGQFNAVLSKLTVVQE
ncbi:molecular chaperone [Pseudoalteromonas sp.]|uniref:molecular chaperone n=1 Tax=Pseudoalteromonas sp. TaxID=53249 RepID=UPI003562AA63